MGNTSQAPKRPKLSVEVTKTRFADAVHGAVMTEVDLSCCVPLVVDRDITRSGVNKTKRIMSGVFADGTKGCSTNVTAGSNCPIVVEITEKYKPYLRAALERCGVEESDIETVISSKGKWYGIVDRAYRYFALIELREEDPDRWECFKWTVLLLKTHPNLHVLYQMKRSDEECRRAENTVEVTLYDEYRRMIKEYKRLVTEIGDESKITSTDIARAYDGQEHKSTDPVAQKCRNARRLGESVIDALGKVMNKEFLHASSMDVDKEHPSRGEPDFIARYVDTRKCRNFTSDRTLKHAIAFMNNKGAPDKSAQVCTIFRLAYLYEQNEFRPFGSAVINEQFEMSKRAMRECKKFELLMGTTEWPEALLVVRTKMTHTTMFDSELLKMKEKGIRPFGHLFEAYYHFNKNVAVQNAKKYKVMMSEGLIVEGYDDSEESSEKPNYDAAATEAPENGADNGNENGVECPSTVPTTPGDEDETSKLSAMGIYIRRETCSMYFANMDTEERPIMDFVFMHPPSRQPSNDDTSSEFHEDLSMDDKKSVCLQCVQIMQRGSYICIWTTQDNMNEWKQAVHEAGFSISAGALNLLSCPEKTQFRKKGMFPEQFCHVAIIGRKKGVREDGFKIDMESEYEHIKCSYPRRVAVIDNIPPPEKRLTFPNSKRPVRTDELNHFTLMEVLQTFCPRGGRVLDLYAGTLSMSTACLLTERKCISVEADEECVLLEVKRLNEVCENMTSTDEPTCRMSDTERHLLRRNVVRAPIQNEESIGDDGNTDVESDDGRMDDSDASENEYTEEEGEKSQTTSDSSLLCAPDIRRLSRRGKHGPVGTSKKTTLRSTRGRPESDGDYDDDEYDAQESGEKLGENNNETKGHNEKETTCMDSGKAMSNDGSDEASGQSRRETDEIYDREMEREENQRLEDMLLNGEAEGRNDVVVEDKNDVEPDKNQNEDDHDSILIYSNVTNDRRQNVEEEYMKMLETRQRKTFEDVAKDLNDDFYDSIVNDKANDEANVGKQYSGERNSRHATGDNNESAVHKLCSSNTSSEKQDQSGQMHEKGKEVTKGNVKMADTEEYEAPVRTLEEILELSTSCDVELLDENDLLVGHGRICTKEVVIPGSSEKSVKIVRILNGIDLRKTDWNGLPLVVVVLLKVEPGREKVEYRGPYEDSQGEFPTMSELEIGKPMAWEVSGVRVKD